MADAINQKNVLRSGFAHPVTRSWQGVNPIAANELMYPLFLTDIDDDEHEISSLPGQYHLGVDKVVAFIEEAVANGLSSVLLFGVVDEDKRDPNAAAAWADDNPVIRAIPLLKAAYPDLCVAVDVCLCPYTDSGMCGIECAAGHHDASEVVLDNVASGEVLARVAVAYAQAGADIIAPSDMFDGRIKAIKDALEAAPGSLNTCTAVMSYSAKYCSAFYGPFRDAVKSGRSSDRSAHQLPPSSSGLGKRALVRDIEEGADMVMIKPGLAYLDMVKVAADLTDVPIAVYQVSGEYAMLWHGAAAGALDLRACVLETMTAFKRAGATIVITYYTPSILKWIKE